MLLRVRVVSAFFAQVELVLYEGCTPPGLSLVSDSVCGVNGQNLRGQPWRGGCLV